MPWFKKRRLPEPIIEPQFVPLCEQAGPAEEELKTRLKTELAARSTVSRAYLISIAYSPDVPPSVALCLRFNRDKEDQHTLDAVARIFESIFRQDQALDIIPLNAELEARVQEYAVPFFAQSV
jgi:hypothetical protein